MEINGRDEDLRMAVALGYLLKTERGAGCASARGGVLTYDPELGAERAAHVCAAIRRDPDRPLLGNRQTMA